MSLHAFYLCLPSGGFGWLWLALGLFFFENALGMLWGCVGDALGMLWRFLQDRRK